MKKRSIRKNKTSVEVDISGRVEDTSTDTIFAFSNSEQYKIKLSKKTKRECVLLLRKLGKHGKSFYLQIYCCGLFCLLKRTINKIPLVTLDEEYRGRDKDIKRVVLGIFTKNGKDIPSDKIRFELIGRKSPAHLVAFTCHQGKSKPDKSITTIEILEQLLSLSELKTIKKDRGLPSGR